MTIIKIMDTDDVTFELIKHQRRWEYIKRNIADVFDHWLKLSKNNLKEILRFEQFETNSLRVEGSALEKNFSLTMTPILIENEIFGKLRISILKFGTKEEISIAEYLFDKEGNISTQEPGPKIDRNETDHPHYTLLMNIIHEVLEH